ncbi:hypothetical protein [Azohydromonas caseinilytica]|uniref:hypothetical protein n=1 Tax=Azohydromonas caseinilytica TaxID=2728836 RepID=UPI0028736D3C|nr:hypothetical protein [Azohydromonas caseinilytica]
MTLAWSVDLNKVNWQTLSDLYRAAPLGDKPPEKLKTAFSNSLFRWSGAFPPFPGIPEHAHGHGDFRGRVHGAGAGFRGRGLRAWPMLNER